MEESSYKNRGERYSKLESEVPETSNKEPTLTPEEACCPICLGPLENKSFTDSCFHEFCFSCLREWAKIKPECPLCKQPFASIIHSVRSNDDYDQFFVEKKQIGEFNSFMNDYQNFRNLGNAIGELMNINRPFVMPRLSFRRSIYAKNKWFKPTNTNNRYRETSPLFYTTNPACALRLMPWINRELRALMYQQENQVDFLTEIISELIGRYDILSPEFNVHLEPYLRRHTAHFAHEFYHFARSPYNMEGYDQRAVYDTRPSTPIDSLVAFRARSPDLDLTNSSSSAASSILYRPLDLASGLPGTSGVSRVTARISSGAPARNPDLSATIVLGDSSDSSDECVIVKVVKPLKERTPEIIEIRNSDSEEELPTQPAIPTSSIALSPSNDKFSFNIKRRSIFPFESTPFSNSSDEEDIDFPARRKLNSVVGLCNLNSNNSKPKEATITRPHKKSKHFKHSRSKHYSDSSLDQQLSEGYKIDSHDSNSRHRYKRKSHSRSRDRSRERRHSKEEHKSHRHHSPKSKRTRYELSHTPPHSPPRDSRPVIQKSSIPEFSASHSISNLLSTDFKPSSPLPSYSKSKPETFRPTSSLPSYNKFKSESNSKLSSPETYESCKPGPSYTTTFSSVPSFSKLEDKSNDNKPVINKSTPSDYLSSTNNTPSKLDPYSSFLSSGRKINHEKRFLPHMNWNKWNSESDYGKSSPENGFGSYCDDSDF